MEDFKKHIGKSVEVTTSGNIVNIGKLIDVGDDLIVIYNGEHFFYIPFLHVHFIHFNSTVNEDYETPEDKPIGDKEDTLSLRKILTNAKGIFTEINVTNNQSIHGYITSVLNDYFVFFSPIYKEIFIPLQHLKYLIPYDPDKRPFSLSNQSFPLTPSSTPLARSFAQQCKKYIGKMVVFDLGMDPKKIGKLVKITDTHIELVVAPDHTIYTHLTHVKTVHIP